jgi:mRNA-degrading endonuclease RelE of RelBE toxin-antitoxin system
MLDTTIQDVLFNQPYETKRLVSIQYRGKRSLRRGDYRIIFAVCEECRKLDQVHLNNCKNCMKHGTNDIVMFTCGHRKHIYDT